MCDGQQYYTSSTQRTRTRVGFREGVTIPIQSGPIRSSEHNCDHDYINSSTAYRDNCDIGGGEGGGKDPVDTTYKYRRNILCQRSLERAFFVFSKTLSPRGEQREVGLHRNSNMPPVRKLPGFFFQKTLFSTHPPQTCVYCCCCSSLPRRRVPRAQ